MIEIKNFHKGGPRGVLRAGRGRYLFRKMRKSQEQYQF